ncbi:hypothetical protein BFJ70_g590 [Fusarium oxysporum]|uniref:chitin synthase n=2 Tax=Fusarium oxysporum TaxID=5507 RepID=A0A2H3G303_FUSOX|nr:hypothetical protein FOWG_11802 [Fusarium oxysporum f. sp. lycopersici MN25]KAF5263467.1 hypothetical protein FOXYS1_5790 [Fusarium oxysporum]PCD25297.1 hypothetical protein AU210_014404 [Fusarium oxysporum f. sp. radicis-cucumerinum]KAJ4123893.1 hypothetical protein NW765_006937 [Fusarium oxysporum]KAJ4271127.1 hypothetical protein NW764_013493 [Fusarium oxysporum]
MNSLTTEPPRSILIGKQKDQVHANVRIVHGKARSNGSDVSDTEYPAVPIPAYLVDEASSNDSYRASQPSSLRSWVPESVGTPDTQRTSVTSRPGSKGTDLIAPIPRLPVSISNNTSVGSRSDAGHSSTPSVDNEITPVPQPSVERDNAPEFKSDGADQAKPKVETVAEDDIGNAVLLKRGKRKVTTQKYILTAGLIAVNFMFIFASWYWPRYYYIYLPFISFPLVLNCIMIASIAVFTLIHWVSPEKQIKPESPENMVYVIPCYNETLEECTRSLDSLVNQTGLENHKKGIMVICDGRVRGPGMTKTTGDYLNEDIFLHQTLRKKILGAYTAWDGQQMDIEISKGFYKGLPFYCIVKDQNQGKRDSLIVIRSFLYKFNTRAQNPESIFSRELLDSMTSWLENEVKMDNVDHLIGMDADTVFEDKCVTELLKESYYPNTVGVCGYVAVDFKDGNWNLWSIYQSAEYTIAQGLRRLHQSIATKKVSCLPGCCQLLKICDETCGDLVLIDLFGYFPKHMDGMLKRIRATASEDRNHICQLLVTFPHAQTRQALHARAYTDVPHSWNVFLSQRRRWTLGATSNDLLLFCAWNTQWWERIVAFSNVLTWSLNVFVIASIGCMIVAFMSQPWWLIMCFAGVMIIPLLYYVIMATWLPRNLVERAQFLLGLVVFVFLGPFLNIAVMLYAVVNMDNFGWGKTRKVITDDSEEGKSSQKEGVVSDSSSTEPKEKTATAV